MLATLTNELALMRFGVGRGGGAFGFILLLAIVAVVVWALARPARQEATKQ
jgi:hypothetical protein